MDNRATEEPEPLVDQAASFVDQAAPFRDLRASSLDRSHASPQAVNFRFADFPPEVARLRRVTAYWAWESPSAGPYATTCRRAFVPSRGLTTQLPRSRSGAEQPRYSGRRRTRSPCPSPRWSRSRQPLHHRRSALVVDLGAPGSATSPAPIEPLHGEGLVGCLALVSPGASLWLPSSGGDERVGPPPRSS